MAHFPGGSNNACNEMGKNKAKPEPRNISLKFWIL